MKILIVDDHDATVAFMRLAFVGAGHIVAAASNVDAALHHVAEDLPDVVLTDLTFGEAHGGLELARSLRGETSTRSVGLLAVSGADAPEILQATVDCGFDGFVAKPVDLPSLLDRVEDLADIVATRRASEDEVDGA